MKIKTVIGKTESEFDNKVNQYLSDGYILARRDIVLDGKGVYASFMQSWSQKLTGTFLNRQTP